MYSPNSAYQLGRRIGRRYSATAISGAALQAAVDQEVKPQIKPRTKNHRNATESAGAFATLAGFLGFLWLAILGLGLFIFPDHEWTQTVSEVLPPIAIPLISVLLGLVFTLALLSYIRTSRKEKRFLQNLTNRLLNAAYQGAWETCWPAGHSSVVERPAQTQFSGPGRSPSPARATLDHFTPRDAEHLAAQWMKRLGAQGVEVTRSSHDGGIDVASTHYIAQVKRFASNVGVAPIRELAGVIRSDRRRGLFFTTTGYSKGAIEFATEQGIALFVMEIHTGQLSPANFQARAFQDHGLN